MRWFIGLQIWSFSRPLFGLLATIATIGGSKTFTIKKVHPSKVHATQLFTYASKMYTLSRGSGFSPYASKVWTLGRGPSVLHTHRRCIHWAMQSKRFNIRSKECTHWAEAQAFAIRIKRSAHWGEAQAFAIRISNKNQGARWHVWHVGILSAVKGESYTASTRLWPFFPLLLAQCEAALQESSWYDCGRNKKQANRFPVCLTRGDFTPISLLSECG